MKNVYIAFLSVYLMFSVFECSSKDRSLASAKRQLVDQDMEIGRMKRKIAGLERDVARCSR